MFSKIVAIEPVSLIPSAEEALHTFANEVVMYPDIPADDEEIVRRIGDADAVLLSYTSSIRREVMERCPNIKYIGMCCSLYSPESANVDIIYANEHGIKVTGIRDYGDKDVCNGTHPRNRPTHECGRQRSRHPVAIPHRGHPHQYHRRTDWRNHRLRRKLDSEKRGPLAHLHTGLERIPQLCRLHSDGSVLRLVSRQESGRPGSDRSNTV